MVEKDFMVQLTIPTSGPRASLWIQIEHVSYLVSIFVL